MRKILIGSHGKMASGIKSSVDILLGNSDCITAIDAYIDETAVGQHIDAFYSKVKDNDTVILLSDILGGSVNQEMFKYLDRPNTFLITGINLGLVIELALDPDAEITEEELNHLIQRSRESVTMVKNEETQEEANDFF